MTTAHRTQEKIIAQCEARYAELEREAASPHKQRPCKTCRFRAHPIFEHCTHPLIVGFGEPDWCYDKNRDRGFNLSNRGNLCGPEKALWEPKPTLSQRIINWFFKPWRE